ncbi:Retinal guanylyl cyclase 1 [Taenia solium]|eukprot:TsM_000989700 transcript=TsM_000989700 gene=TsM_000989700
MRLVRIHLHEGGGSIGSSDILFQPLRTKSHKLWTSPELLRDETVALLGTKPDDVYAFAIIMHEVFYQTKPHGPKDLPVDEILESVVAKESPPSRTQLPKTGNPLAYRDIPGLAWSENPNLRPTFGGQNGEIQQMTKGH